MFFAAAPQLEPEQREHSVDKGETLKVKIPFSGTGPFSFKLKKGNREIPESDRVKLIPFEDYVVLQIKGMIIVLKHIVLVWRVDGEILSGY